MRYLCQRYGNKEKLEFPGVDRHHLGAIVLLDRSRWVVSQPPLSTSPLADWRFLYCVLLDCHQMLAGKWKLCLSFPMRRFHLQSQSCKLVRKKKEEIFIPQNTPWLSFDIINSPLQFCIYLYCSFLQWTLKDICSETLYQCIQLDTCHCLNMDCCCRDSV